VAEAVFQKITADERITASALSYTPLIGQQTDFDIFVSSHFHDAALFRLRTVKDPEALAQLE